jgi:hypothetical protein
MTRKGAAGAPPLTTIDNLIVQFGLVTDSTEIGTSAISAMDLKEVRAWVSSPNPGNNAGLEERKLAAASARGVRPPSPPTFLTSSADALRAALIVSSRSP